MLHPDIFAKLGHDHPHGAAADKSAQPLCRMLAREQLVEFDAYAFGSDVAEKPAHLARRRGGLFLGGKTQNGDKAVKPHDTQSVLAEHAPRIVHGAQQAGVKIGFPAQKIERVAAENIVIKRVDGEVTPPRVFFYVLCKAHACGLMHAAARRITVHAEGGIFIAFFALDHDRAQPL